MDKRKIIIESIANNIHSLKRMLLNNGHYLHNGFSITMTQGTVLFLIHKRGEMSVTEIAAELGVSKSAATQLLNSLFSQQLLSSEIDQTDHRSQKIKLSELGKKHLSLVREKSMARFLTVFETLNEKELGQLEKITKKLLKVEAPIS